ADLQDEFRVRIELEQLRLAAVRALKHPEVAFRIERHRRDPAETGGQVVRVRERVTQRLLPLHALQRLPRNAVSLTAQRRAAASRRGCWDPRARALTSPAGAAAGASTGASGPCRYRHLPAWPRHGPTA